MGYNEYVKSQQLESVAMGGDGNAFYALLMAAMRQADTDNLNALKLAFPLVYDELMQRFNAPGGVLKHEREY
jgi:hypothetical protein